MTTKKKPSGTRRGLTHDEIIKSIVESYHPTDGCPPLSEHWGGYPLAETPWLRRFAEEIASNKINTAAWDKLKNRVDSSFAIELLYLLAYRGDTTEEHVKDAYRGLAIELEKVIVKYEKLHGDLFVLMGKTEFSHPLLYLGDGFTQELRVLQEAKRRLEEVRDSIAGKGSHKRVARDWYLLFLAKAASDAKGHLHIKELATLIECARAANGVHRGHPDPAALGKRVQRWMKYMNVIDGRMMLRSGGHAVSSAPSEPINDRIDEIIDDSHIPF